MTVNNNIKVIHDLLLEMAIVFHDILVRNNIPYYMLGGTMLGAIRHQGFIPWDDDMDFGIPREYYATAISILEKELPKNYRLRKATEGNVLYDGCKIENIKTIVVEKGHENEKYGLFIDLFPLDKSNNKWGVLSRNWWIKHIMGINLYKFRWPRSLKEQFIALLVRVFPKNFFNKLSHKMLFKDGAYLANYGGMWGMKEIVPVEYFGVPHLYQFENIQLYGLAESDKYLKCVYGDYMQLPSENKRHIHIISCTIID